MWKPRPREEEPVESCPEVGIVFWIWRVPGSTGQEKVGRVRVLFPSAGHPDMTLFGQTDELYFMQEAFAAQLDSMTAFGLGSIHQPHLPLQVYPGLDCYVCGIKTLL